MSGLRTTWWCCCRAESMKAQSWVECWKDERRTSWELLVMMRRVGVRLVVAMADGEVIRNLMGKNFRLELEQSVGHHKRGRHHRHRRL